ncbi:MAG: PAS domain-containing sensor histidine kinase, partial [Pseudomonadota bacterium]
MTLYTVQEKKRRRRELIGIIIIAVLIPLVSYFQSKRFILDDLPISNTLFMFTLVNVNILLLLVLVFLVLRNIAKLIYDRRKKVVGSRLRTRLIVAFVAMAILPTILLFFVSMKIVTASLDFWFNSPVEQSLKNSITVGKSLYQQIKSTNLFFSKKIAEEISTCKCLSNTNDSALKKYLNKARADYNLQTIEVYSSRSVRLAFSKAQDIPELSILQ